MNRTNHYVLLLTLLLSSCHSQQSSQQSENSKFVVEYDCFAEGQDTLATNVRIHNADGICLFADTDNVFLPEACPLLCVRPSRESVTYFLFRKSDPISNKTLLILGYDNSRGVKQSLLCADYIVDINHDGLYEIIGQQWVEAYNWTCDSAYYSPIDVYVLGNDALVYDENLSNTLTKGVFGCHLQLPYNIDTVLPYNSAFVENYIQMHHSDSALSTIIPVHIKNNYH